MQVSVIGIRRVDIDPDASRNQNSTHGFSVYYSFEDVNVFGQQTDKVFLSDAILGRDLPSVRIEPGSLLQIDFTRHGKLQRISGYVPPARVED